MQNLDKVKKLLRQEKRDARRDMRIEKKYTIAENKIKNAYKISKEKGDAFNKKFGYNYEGAIKAGIEPDETGHWASRDPETGEIFKGRKHPTISRTKKAEKALGYKIKNIKGTLYSLPKK